MELSPAMPARADAHPHVPPVIEPLSADVLLVRSTVAKFIDEWQPIGKTAYVNSDTSFRNGRACVAYESGASSGAAE